MSKKSKVYAYYLIETDEKSIVSAWEECQKKVKGKKARYKSFNTENEALEWLQNGAEYEADKNKTEKLDRLISELDRNAIYFDAGTGRGQGVEVRLTDFDGEPLLSKILDKSRINDYGNYYLSKGRTNNFGELTGLYAALKYALKYDINKICGDSFLIIEYWSKGRYNGEQLENDTVELIKKVISLRKKFENRKGKIEKISGDINPADLGFHK